MAWTFRESLAPRRLVDFLYNQLVPLAMIVFGLIGLWTVSQLLEPVLQDRLLRWTAPPVAADSPVALVLMDEDSMQYLSERYGSPPWTPEVYLQLLQAVQQHQPAVLALDSYFTSQEQHHSHTWLTQAMQQNPNLLVGMAVGSRQPFNPRTNPGYYRLNFGITNLEPSNTDGVVRSLRPYWVYADPRLAGVFPSFALATVLEYANRTHGRGSTSQGPQPDSANTSASTSWMIRQEDGTSLHGAKLHLFPENRPNAGRQLPLNEQGQFILRWYAPLTGQNNPPARTQHLSSQSSHPIIPLWQLLGTTPEALALQTKLAGRIVLLGAVENLYQDHHPTPMSYRHMGLDIQATAIENMLNGTLLARAPEWLRGLIVLVGFVGVFLLRVRVESYGRTMLYTASLMVLYFWIVLHQLIQQHQLLDVVTPELFMIVGLLAGTLWWARGRDQMVHQLERTVSQLVSPSVFREIQRMGEVLMPGGQRLEISSMFVDIRNFTALAENLPPTELTELLNAFYTAVESAVFVHRGTVDKYMGDGVLLIFGAPLPSVNHADQALAAAQEVLHTLSALSRRWQLEQRLSFEVGISLNSGQAFVGFLGPTHKLEYTAVGDTVNLAVRLQEHNKRLNLPLVISEYTVAYLTSSESRQGLQPLGEVCVRGRESSIGIFTLAGTAVSEPFSATETITTTPDAPIQDHAFSKHSIADTP